MPVVQVAEAFLAIVNKEMHEVELSTNVSGWHAFRARRKNEKFRALAMRVMKRDQFACHYCGFRAQKFQQVINIDGNYQNNVESNLAVACVLCSQCHFIGGGEFGKIIYLPEYTQVELNCVVRAIFCAIISGNQYTETAKALYRNFRNRAQHVEATFGENTSDAIVFGQSIIDSGIDLKKNGQEVMRSLRLLPFRAPLEKPVRYWATIVEPYWR